MKWLKALFEHGKAYLVGGPVRDELMGLASKDLDILVTGIPSDELQEILQKHGSVHLVGQFFGIFKFKPHDSEQTIDIALPRREQSTGTGHRDFEVQCDPHLSVEEDLHRRDFTVNSMAKNLKTNELIDPWGGVQDLKNKCLRQVFDNTFQEDPLRMLRAFQFAARFEFFIDPKTYEGIKKTAQLILSVSAERIYSELGKLLKAKRPSIGFQLMNETGVLQHVIPELQATVDVQQPEQFHKHPVFEHTLEVVDACDPNNPIVRWAALLHDLGKPDTQGTHPKNGRITFFGHEKVSERLAHDVLKRLKAPETVINKITRLCRHHMFAPEAELTDRALRRLIHRVGPDHIIDLIALRRADRLGSGHAQDLLAWDNLLERAKQALADQPLTKKDLAVDGHQLIHEFNLDSGPLVGDLLDELLLYVLDQPERNTKKDLFKKAKKILKEKR